MKRTIHLDTDEIYDLIEELNDYANSLTSKCQLFVQALADVGIKTARANLGQYQGLILFSKEVDVTETGARAIMVATDGQKVIRSWKYKGGTKTVEVSPLLMAEFGSGWKAKVLDDVEGVGQGTFPGQTHAYDPWGWWWQDENGVTHHSSGEAPTFPMHSASLAMVYEMQRIAEEVFGG